jgi:hypothetical protein
VFSRTYDQRNCGGTRAVDERKAPEQTLIIA